MHICHLILRPRLSGAEKLVADLSLEQLKAGETVSIFSLEPMESNFHGIYQTLASAGVNIHFPDYKSSRFGRLARLLAFLAKQRPDCVFAHSVIPSLYVRLVQYLRHHPADIICSVLHDASQDDYNSLLYRCFESSIAPEPNALICVAPIARANYFKRCGYVSDGGVIYNGIKTGDIKAAQVRRGIVREQLGYQPNQRIVLQVGRINPVKRQLETVKSFRRIADPCLSLILVGLVEDNHYLSEINAAIESGGLSDKIRILPPTDKIFDLLAAADVYVMPSLAEGFSVAFLEALASGLPIICSDIDAFSFAKAYDGVTHVDPSNYASYAAAMVSARNANRFHRDMRFYSVDNTANAYSNLACVLNFKNII